MIGLCVLRRFSVRRQPAAPALLTLPAREMNGKRIWPERGECYTVRRFGIFTRVQAARFGVSACGGLIVLAEQDGRGEDSGPKAAFVAHGRLRDVHCADDLV